MQRTHFLAKSAWTWLCDKNFLCQLTSFRISFTFTSFPSLHCKRWTSTFGWTFPTQEKLSLWSGSVTAMSSVTRASYLMKSSEPTPGYTWQITVFCGEWTRTQLKNDRPQCWATLALNLHICLPVFFSHSGSSMTETLIDAMLTCLRFYGTSTGSELPQLGLPVQVVVCLADSCKSNEIHNVKL